MIFIFTALFCEAENLIREFKLKKNTNPYFSQYEGDGIVLTVTGPGQIKASASVALTLGKMSENGDSLISIGSAAGRKEDIGRIFLINSLYNDTSGKSFFPDMLFKTGLEEKCLITLGRQIDGGLGEGRGTLYDMEGASVYETALFFLPPERLMFLRLVTDDGHGSLVKKEDLKNYFSSNINSILEIIDMLSELKKEVPLNEEPLRRLSSGFSETMYQRLKRLVFYEVLKEGTGNRGVEERVSELIREGLLPAKNKMSGLKVLKILEDRLYEHL